MSNHRFCSPRLLLLPILGVLLATFGWHAVAAELDSGADATSAAETETEQPAEPEPPSELTVVDVRVEGSDNVDEVITNFFREKTYFQTRPGEEISNEALTNDIKRIYTDFGPFADIQVDVTPAEGGGLLVTFKLTEYPRVSGDIEVIGNEALSYKKLRKLFTLKDGERFSEYELWKTKRAILEEYQKRGYYFAKVESETEPVEGEDAVRIRITIDEGERVKVKEVRFEGNELISDKELRKVIKTKKGKRFQDETFEEDPQYILSLYQEKGFLNAKVLGQSSELDEEGTGILVTFEIYEGPQFLFDGYEIEFTEPDPEVSEEEIRKELELEPGDIFNAVTYREDYDRVRRLYENRGNILAQIEDSLDTDLEKETVRATFRITEGNTITIGEIRIKGLVKTKEYVIRRELERFDIAPGKMLRAQNLQKAQQNIIQLGTFIQGIQFLPQPTDEPDVNDLVVEIKESERTGIFSIGGGYGSESGLFGVAEMTNANLFGRAYRMNIRAELGQRARRVGQISFGTPWIFGTPTSVNAQLYSINRRRYLYGYRGAVTANNSYEDFRQGASLTLGTPITRNMRVFTTIRDETVQANYIPLEDNKEIGESFFVGSRETRSITVGLTRDTRRYRTSLFDAIGGGYDTVSFEHSGGVLGGRNAFRKYSLESRRFFPSFWKFVFALHLRASYLEDRSGVSPVYLFYERFWLGGVDTVRGFPDYSILPVTKATKTVGGGTLNFSPQIGGNKMFYANLEYRFPIHQLARGLVFLDVGQVWNEGTSNIFKELDPVVSVGAGVRLEIVPGFLIRLEWGVPLTTLPLYDPTSGTVERRSFGPRFHFTMGPSF